MLSHLNHDRHALRPSSRAACKDRHANSKRSWLEVHVQRYEPGEGCPHQNHGEAHDQDLPAFKRHFQLARLQSYSKQEEDNGDVYGREQLPAPDLRMKHAISEALPEHSHNAGRAGRGP